MPSRPTNSLSMMLRSNQRLIETMGDDSSRASSANSPAPIFIGKQLYQSLRSDCAYEIIRFNHSAVFEHNGARPAILDNKILNLSISLYLPPRDCMNSFAATV